MHNASGHLQGDTDADATFFAPLFRDGLPLLLLGALGLMACGGFALFLSASGEFLPHDVQYLGMTASELCAHNGCRIVHFMIHDRASFGATLVALGVMYLWLIHFPLRRREAWAWWTLLISNVAGFLSFLAYLGFGYFDRWHGAATLLLLGCFGPGLWLSFGKLAAPRGVACLCGTYLPDRLRARWGRWLLLAVAAAMVAAGLTITTVGMTSVFVPQDLQFMDTTAQRLRELSPRLIPLIAHDRAGFGGAVANVGLVIFACGWCGGISRHLWQALSLVGAIGFGIAIGVHPLVGYNNPVHLAPACAGAIGYLAAIILLRPQRKVQSQN